MKKMLFARLNGILFSFYFIDDTLYEMDMEQNSTQELNSIYIGKIKKILPNLNAAFVEYQKGKQGFLSLDGIDGKLHQEMEIPVQIMKTAVKTKEPVLTTNLALTGSYCVVTNGKTQIGFSNKIASDRKKELKENLTIPIQELKKQFPEISSNIGIVIRTNAALSSVTKGMILTEVQKLISQMAELLAKAKTRTVFSCLHKAESFCQMKLARTYLSDLDEIVTDQSDIYDELLQIQSNFADINSFHVRLYEDDSYPISALYSLRTKALDAFERKVWMKSGGFLVIDETEALTVIDVNSGKNISGKDKEKTIQKLNCEAAIECARQLRLRNLSGIVIIDFINCKNTDSFIFVLKQELKKDPVKASFVDITPLGLVEVTRKKITAPLSEKLKKADAYEIFRT